MCTLWSQELVKKSCNNINNSPEKFSDYVISCDYGLTFRFSDRTLLDVYTTLKCLVTIGGGTCCQFQTRVDDPLRANKLSTICK